MSHCWVVLFVSLLLQGTSCEGISSKVRNRRDLEITDKIAQSVVDAHNKVRANVEPEAANMIQLIYDEDLEKLARVHAKKCHWEHSTKNSRKQSNKYSYIGENLQMAWPPKGINESLMEAVKGWSDEVKYYNYYSGGCTSGQMCGHYTQVVWATTEAVGCAVHTCPTLTMPGRSSVKNAQYVVCNYGPGGNIRGIKPYIEGKSNTQCPVGIKCLEKSSASNVHLSSVGLVTMLYAVLSTML